MPMRRPLVALAVLALLLTGCAEQQPAQPGGGTSAGSTPGNGVTPTPAPTDSATPAPGDVALTVHRGSPPGGVRRGPAWRLVSADPAASAVRITWYDGAGTGCGTVQDVWVRETSAVVVIDLVRSAVRPGVACPALLAPRTATIPLAAPVG